jgi:hypothetical protein
LRWGVWAMDHMSWVEQQKGEKWQGAWGALGSKPEQGRLCLQYLMHVNTVDAPALAPPDKGTLANVDPVLPLGVQGAPVNAPENCIRDEDRWWWWW